MKKLLLLSLLLFAQPALTADESLHECRQVEADAERVACYDKFVDSHFSTDSSAIVDLATPHQTSKSNSIPDAQSLFGTDDAEAKRLVETSLEIEQINEIAAIITDVRRSSAKKLTVILDNGQTWHQLDRQRLSLKSGDAVIVRKASLSSYLMEKQSGSRSIRVKRAN